MSTVTAHFLLEDLLVQAPIGTSLQAIADASGADITFGCRNGSCGTCRIRVTKGLELCSEMGSEERDFLKGLGVAEDERLACQVSVMGDIEVDYLGL